MTSCRASELARLQSVGPNWLDMGSHLSVLGAACPGLASSALGQATHLDAPPNARLVPASRRRFASKSPCRRHFIIVSFARSYVLVNSTRRASFLGSPRTINSHILARSRHRIFNARERRAGGWRLQGGFKMRVGFAPPLTNRPALLARWSGPCLALMHQLKVPPAPLLTTI